MVNNIYNYKNVEAIIRNKPETVEFTILESSEPLNPGDINMILYNTLKCIHENGAVATGTFEVPHIELPKGIKQAAAIRVAGYIIEAEASRFEVNQIKKQYVKDIKQVDYILDKTTGSIKPV